MKHPARTLSFTELWAAGDDLSATRRELPEEFWDDFDRIIALLQQAMANLIARITQAATAVAGLNDKELALRLAGQPEAIRSFLFPWRKSGGKPTGKNKETLFRAVRPAGNGLPGYTPSYAMQRVSEEL